MTRATMESRGARAAGPVADRRGGFTMVEVIIAIVILTVGVLAMASTTAFVVRQTTFADLLTERAVAFQTVVNRVEVDSFDAVLEGGSDSVGIFYAEWTAALDDANSAIVTIVTTGPGLDRSSGFPVMSPQVADTFLFRKLRVY